MLEHPLLVPDCDNKYSEFCSFVYFKGNELITFLDILCLDLDIHILHFQQYTSVQNHLRISFGVVCFFSLNMLLSSTLQLCYCASIRIIP